MRVFLFLQIIIFLNTNAIAQNTFNESFFINNSILRFSNIMHLNEDTLMLYGFTYDNSNPPLQSILMARIDTSGNVINYNITSDSSGYEYFLEPGSGLIELDNGQICGVAKPVHDTKIAFLLFDRNGKLETRKIYDDTTVLFATPRKVIELEDGFLIAGYKQRQNFYQDIFIMKIDKQGNVVWEKSYGGLNTNDRAGSFVKIDENTFVFGAVVSSSYSLPMAQTWSRSRVFAIDSTGNIKWDWMSGVNEEIGIVGLNPSSDGGWVYCSGTRTINEEWDWFNVYPKIIKRDGEMNKIWESSVNVGTVPLNSFTDLKPAPDGHWIGAGYWALPFDNIDDGRLGGGLYNVTPDGQLCWTRNDSSEWSITGRSRDHFAGLAVLPSGSIIAAGWSEKYEPNPDQTFGWVVKVDKNGGMDTLLCGITSVKDLHRETHKMEVFPNPASDQVTFKLHKQLEMEGYTLLQVSNMAGEILITHQFLPNAEPSFDFNTSKLPAGVYPFRVISKNGTFQAGKILVLH
jgi:hypothetical protein